jgi:hypothetical protein
MTAHMPRFDVTIAGADLDLFFMASQMSPAERDCWLTA